jgi:hypothetical protein
MNIENAAKLTAELAYKDDQKKQFDPMTIIMLISVIMSVITAIKKCKDEKDVPKAAAKRGIVDRTIVHRIVKKTLSAEQWKTEGKVVINAIFEAGAKSTVEDISALYQEVK